MGLDLKNLKKGDGPNGDINITPLIDIVLVLLIIFMVITPITIQEMAVNLPEKTETVEQDDLPKEQLVAAVCKDGSITLNRRTVSIEELHSKVRKRLRSKSHKVIFVDGHPDAPYERVVEVMDTARDAGADKIGLASLKTDEEFRACTAAAPAGATPVDGVPGAPGSDATAPVPTSAEG